MIGRIAGVILHRAADHVLIDVRGVGYVVHVSERTAASLPPAGQAVALYTDLLVRDDLLQLFGFTSLIDKEWHRLLTSVQGVGAKVSLALLGTLGGEGLGRALALEDAASLRRAPGVGPKLAARIVMELKDKAPGVIALGGVLTADAGSAGVTAAPDPAPAAPVQGDAPAPSAASPNSAHVQADAMSALCNLGYAPGEAVTALAEAATIAPDADTSALIRAALRILAPKG